MRILLSDIKVKYSFENGSPDEEYRDIPAAEPENDIPEREKDQADGHNAFFYSPEKLHVYRV